MQGTLVAGQEKEGELATSLKFIRLLRVVFSSKQHMNRPAVNAVQ